MKKWHRILSVVICFVLILFCLYKPINVQAYNIPSFSPGYSALFSMFFSSGFVTVGANAIADVLQPIWDCLTDSVKDIFISYEENLAETFRPELAVIGAFCDAVNLATLKAMLSGTKLMYAHRTVDLSAENIQEKHVVGVDTTLKLPTASMVQNYSSLAPSDFIVTRSYFAAITDWLSSLNYNLQARLSAITDWTSTINNNIKVKINLLQDWFPIINNNIQSR